MCVVLYRLVMFLFLRKMDQFYQSLIIRKKSWLHYLQILMFIWWCVNNWSTQKVLEVIIFAGHGGYTGNQSSREAVISFPSPTINLVPCLSIILHLIILTPNHMIDCVLFLLQTEDDLENIGSYIVSQVSSPVYWVTSILGLQVMHH